MSFAEQVTAFVEKTKIKQDQVLRKIGFDCFVGIVRKTPVDTGRARASWNISVNTIDPKVAPEPTDKAAARAAPMPANMDGAVSTVAAATWGDVIFISNNLPYAAPLEAGHSKQAPNGMVRLTVIEVEADFQRALASLG